MNLLELTERIVNYYLSHYCSEPPIVKYLIAPEIGFKVLKFLLKKYTKYSRRKNKSRKRKEALNIQKIIKEEKDAIRPVLEKLVRERKRYGELYKKSIENNQPIVFREFFKTFEGASEKNIRQYLGIDSSR